MWVTPECERKLKGMLQGWYRDKKEVYVVAFTLCFTILQNIFVNQFLVFCRPR